MSTDQTAQFIRHLLGDNGVFMVTVRGKRIVGLARCQVPFVSPVAQLSENLTIVHLRSMLQRRAGLFLVQVFGGAIVSVGCVEAPIQLPIQLAETEPVSP